MHPNVAKARSLKAVAHRRGDQAAILEAGRELAAAKLEVYIQRTIESAPPLTPEQRDRLAGLLRPASSAGSGAA